MTIDGEKETYLKTIKTVYLTAQDTLEALKRILTRICVYGFLATISKTIDVQGAMNEHRM